METSVAKAMVARVGEIFRKAKAPLQADSYDSLQEDVLLALHLGHLLHFCEKDTILGLFHIQNFGQLHPGAYEIEQTLREHMLDPISNVYLAAARRIKRRCLQERGVRAGSAELELKPEEECSIRGDNTSRIEKPGLAHHILGVFTSLLQMYYYAMRQDPGRLDSGRLQVGSHDVALELANTFRKLHPKPELDDTFRKWAFISLFHDIAKIEETYSPLKHDETSATFLSNHGIFEMLQLPEEDKAEARVIIGEHVELGCHGPADHSMKSLLQFFTRSDLYEFFTHKDGGNVNPDRLKRFFDNALLMWTHDAAGTTRKGLATSLPFAYLRDTFSAVWDLAKDKNILRDGRSIGGELEQCGTKRWKERMGRILCAWVMREDAKDAECADRFETAMEEAVGRGEIGREDANEFPERLASISGKNHLFNMLILPIRRSAKDDVAVEKAYRVVAKGFVLVAKAATILRIDDVRAVNAECRMELDESKRGEMAQALAEVVERARDVSLAPGDGDGAAQVCPKKPVVFVDGHGKRINSSVTFEEGWDENAKKTVVFVKIGATPP